ncbi:T9SS type A sorting domain-containing protein [Chryseobacterium sp. JV558]|uniref:T9SS type A sorting domain-containing protein n=1 Tax=Chryseobacterium sp. JV558 TaxID=2663236 RepID=UPI00299E1678|nr:T9SS type A sorting domain-containing protein [Chryseobacterium sp. JV558]
MAQIIIGPVETYKATFTRHDDYGQGHIAYANAALTLEINTGVSAPQSNLFPPNNITSKDYAFPSFTTSSQVTYVKAKLNDLGGAQLVSGYYPLSTVVGSHTTISDPNLIAYQPTYSGYGYGVDIYCDAPNQYTIRVTKFLCYTCVRPTVSKNGNLQSDNTVLVPNPSMGFSELYYTAADKETISINVVDINGKVVRAYTTDIEAGLNKLPIDLKNSLGGTYVVQWKSSIGKSGTLKLIKNK